VREGREAASSAASLADAGESYPTHHSSASASPPSSEMPLFIATDTNSMMVIFCMV